MSSSGALKKRMKYEASDEKDAGDGEKEKKEEGDGVRKIARFCCCQVTPG